MKTLVRNGRVALDGKLQALDVLVEGERIAAVGTLDAASADRVVDAQGCYVLPGFIDAHLHVISLGFAQMTLDLSGTKSLEDALAKIAAYSAENPELPWIIGRGWNQETWALGRFPTAAELDAVTGNRPVWLERVDGHAGWANTAALKAAGVDEIWCVSVNDAFVMGAWANDQQTAGKVRMLADGDAVFTRATGLTLDLTGKGLGLRSNRYSMLVKEGVIKALNVEGPGQFAVSDAATLLAQAKAA